MNGVVVATSTGIRIPILVVTRFGLTTIPRMSSALRIIEVEALVKPERTATTTPKSNKIAAWTEEVRVNLWTMNEG